MLRIRQSQSVLTAGGPANQKQNSNGERFPRVFSVRRALFLDELELVRASPANQRPEEAVGRERLVNHPWRRSFLDFAFFPRPCSPPV